MRKGIAILAGIIVLLFLMLGYSYLKNKEQNISPSITSTTSSPSPSLNAKGYCTQEDIKAELRTEGAAGSIYGTFAIKNISATTCMISGNDFIAANFNKSITNLSVTHTGTTQIEPFELASGQTLYSQMRYPNGPQCSDIAKMTQVTFTYKISPTSTIVFANEKGNKTMNIPICQNQSEITKIEIWNLSTSSIVQ